MSWVAVAGLAVGAGTAAISASQQKKAATAAGNAPASQKLQTYQPFTIPYSNVAQANPTQAAQYATNTNSALFNQNAQLAQKTNAFNYQNAVHYYSKIQPYFQQLQAQLGKNALESAQGNLPSDVQSNIQRMAATQGIAGGFGYGTSAAQGGLGNLNLRNLGLTSLSQEQYGNTLGMELNQEAKALQPNYLSPSDMFISPQSYLGGQEFNAGQVNQTNLANAGYINQARAVNAGAYNALQQNITQGSIVGQLASAQATGQGIQGAGSAIGTLLSNQSGSGGLFNTPASTSGSGPVPGVSSQQFLNSTGSTAFDPNALA